MTIHSLILWAAELDRPRGTTLQVRVPVRASNSITAPGTFAMVDLETGRGREVAPGSGQIRAQSNFGSGKRVVSVSPKVQPGDVLRVKVRHDERGRAGRPLQFKVLAIHGRRVRDVQQGEGFAVEGWIQRHGRPAFDGNGWVWAMDVRLVRGGK